MAVFQKTSFPKKIWMPLKRGIVNLEKHIENIQKFGVPVVVTLNSFITDTEAEYAYIKRFCEDRGCEFALAEVWAKGRAKAAWP